MTDFAALLQPDRGGPARTIHLVDRAGFDDWLKTQPASRPALLEAMRFDGKTAFQFAVLPGAAAAPGEFEIVSTVADASKPSPWCLAKLGEALPEGQYRLASGELGPAALGWLLGQHRFDRYKGKPADERGPRVLLTGEAARIGETVRLAEATALVRDLVDTPAADLGPAELEREVRERAKAWGAEVTVTSGDALRWQNGVSVRGPSGRSGHAWRV